MWLPKMTGVLIASTIASAALADEPPKMPDGAILNVKATVNHSVLGCWVLETQFGRLEATNLAPEFEVENLKVIVTIRKRLGVATTCMVGRAIVTISSIARSGDTGK
jgi:hypothetical protein